jgi:hypothetical protein
MQLNYTIIVQLFAQNIIVTKNCKQASPRNSQFTIQEDELEVS